MLDSLNIRLYFNVIDEAFLFFLEKWKFLDRARWISRFNQSLQYLLLGPLKSAYFLKQVFFLISREIILYAIREQIFAKTILQILLLQEKRHAIDAGLDLGEQFWQIVHFISWRSF